MDYKPHFPDVNIETFIYDWNAEMPTKFLKTKYDFKTIQQVNAFVRKMRAAGYDIRYRVNKKGVKHDNRTNETVGNVSISWQSMETES